MRLSAIAALLVAIAGCTPGASLAEDPQGAFRFPLGEDAQPETDGDKVRWRMSVVTVAAQRLTRTAINRRRSLAEIARALQERYDLGEVEGSIVVPPCTLAGRDGHCLEGHIMDDNQRVERRGWLMEDDDDLLLIELTADVERRDELATEKRRVENGFEWLETGR